MTVTSDSLSKAVGGEAGNELHGAFEKIEHCVNQLSQDQLWWRPSETMNSVANLMLHLRGNLRQWIVSGVGGVVDIRERQDEFDARTPIPMVELVQKVRDTVTAARTVLSTVSAKELLRVRRIQGFNVTGLQAIFESVAHFRGHTQEIIHLTRCQLGDSYKIDFIPASVEQGRATKG